MKIIKDLLEDIRRFFSIPLYEGNDVSIQIGTILTILVGCLVAYYLLRLIRKLITAKLPATDKNKFISIFKFIQYLVYLLVVITVLNTSGVDLTVLLTASAALFVGLGFALQYLFQDIISGIMIILDQSLHIGDIIEIENKVGKVTDIKLRTTRAITRDDKILVIPNHKFLTDSVFNYTQNHRTTRELVRVGVAYGSDTKLVTRLLLEAASESPGVLSDPEPFVMFEDFGDSALIFSVNFFIRDSFVDPRIKSDIRYSIDAKFRENNVTIPFPQRDVHLFNKTS
ncbi:mechanosensitive ion channel family protein [Robertkochia aurantiaca]|uniref:mechanosensitive ion channel family protein n=1 Tax=Robertkochia aurantiaca TaxID=2873700 RepID=UPI001CCA0767|nr:mechanosensitive ion channel domain-containing protein [Robertkochia sp. 3YJGBD-33]